MQINKIQIWNFRIHENLAVEFAKGCTVITGLNESGKSTLFEAIHCVLFMKHRKTGELHDAIRRRNADFPEVELWFEAQGTSWHLRKRFAGSSTKSICSLSDGGRQSYAGEAAENTLATLVRFDLADPIDGNRERLRGNASHLWVWQGTSGGNPAGELGRRHDAIVERLQAVGVAGIMQSQLDAGIAGIFEQRRSALLTERQQPKAGTDLWRVSQEVTDLQKSVDDQRSQVKGLEEAAREHDASVKKYDESRRELERLNSELLKLNARAEEAGKFKAKLAEVESRQAAFEGQRDELDSKEDEIASRRARLAAAKRKLEPGVANANALESRRSAAGVELETKRADRRRASLFRQECERRRDIADAWERLLGFKQELAAAEARATEEKSLAEQLSPLVSSLAKLPMIDRKTANRIVKLELARRLAKATLDAASAQITVKSASCPILVNGESLEPGDARYISTSAQIVVGSVAELTLRVGGKTLVDLQAGLDAADAELANALLEAQAESAEHAEQIASERDRLTEQQNALQQRRDALRADGGRSLHEIQADITPAEARVEALCNSLSAEPETAALLSPPASIAAAKQSAQAHRKSASDAESDERALNHEIDGLDALYDSISEALKTQAEENSADGQEVSAIQGGLEELLRAEGSDADRARRREDVAATLLSLTSHQKELNAKLDELDPQRLDQESKRIKGLINTNQMQFDDARESLTRTKTKLHLDGSSDPRQRLSELEGRLDSRKAERQSLQDRCDAIALLDRLFRDARENVGAVLGGALAQRVAPYLRVVFGAGTGLVITRAEDGDYTLRLRRASGATEDFDTLSGGTKEQVATAVRLATAELLAASFDGCLPLIFDDAFVNSDSERTKKIAMMLFEASGRGIQVIVGSCQPGDYKDLPGTRIELTPPAPFHAARAPMMTDAPAPGDSALDGAPDDEEQFIASLQEAGGSSGNQSLRTRLGWDADRYERVKGALAASGRISLGAGRGGSVRLTQMK
jgi:DNA repair exonuclease SbcCD ATPase subunit